MRMRRTIVFYGPSGSTTFVDILVNCTIFGGEKLLNTQRVLIFTTTFIWNMSHFKKNSAR